MWIIRVLLPFPASLPQKLFRRVNSITLLFSGKVLGGQRGVLHLGKFSWDYLQHDFLYLSEFGSSWWNFFLFFSVNCQHHPRLLSRKPNEELCGELAKPLSFLEMFFHWPFPLFGWSCYSFAWVAVGVCVVTYFLIINLQFYFSIQVTLSE